MAKDDMILVTYEGSNPVWYFKDQWDLINSPKFQAGLDKAESDSMAIYNERHGKSRKT